MYIPKIYRIEDRGIIEDFIRNNGFATLISATESYPLATHIPLDLQVTESGKHVLWGHVSKGNPHWKQFKSNPKVLAVFLSHIHSYISSSWYDHPNVPTWNYMSAQVTGTISLIEGEKLWKSVSKLTDKYEKDSKHPVSLETMPASAQRKMNGLVGFEIEIEQMECAFKLSQNRDEKNLKNIIKQLNLREDIISKMMAEVMQEEVLLKKLEDTNIHEKK